MKTLTILLLTIFTLPIFSQVNYTYYSKAEVEEDVRFAFDNFRHIHPLFADSRKLVQYESRFSELTHLLKDSMTQNEVYLDLAPLFASLNDGHTGVIMPFGQRIEYVKAGGTSFPFFVEIVGEELYISFYCGNDTTLFVGGEQILEINGIKTAEMVHKMETLYSGESLKIKHKSIADKFRFLVWMLYSFDDEYELLIKDNQNEVRTLTVPGVSGADFKKNIQRKPTESKETYSLDIHPDKSMAVFRIGSFADLNGFCAFADSAFKQIQTLQIQNLILDVRDNSGGRSIVVDSLMDYLTAKPYAQYKQIEMRVSQELKDYYKVRYPNKFDWINSLANNEVVVSRPDVTLPHDSKLRFEGNLFLLTNTGTYSAASTFAGVFKDLELGTIIGEETGGTIAYYGDFWFLQTPNSKIKFHVSPKRFVQFGGADYDRGVLPNLQVPDVNDSIIDFTFSYIRKL
jgi:C-terminal processing protease CtpA/Prc